MAYGLALHRDMKKCNKGPLLRIESGDVLPDSDDSLLHRVLGGIIGSSWTLDGAFMSTAGDEDDRQVLGRGAPTP